MTAAIVKLNNVHAQKSKLQEKRMSELHVWTDGSWILKEDYCENSYRYKGVDFFSMFVEEVLEDDEIDMLVYTVVYRLE